MYNYIFVREDIPLADQLVQVGHVCLEAGTKFGSSFGTPSLVLLKLKDLLHLEETTEFLEDLGIEFVTFNEPDDNMGKTAVCTQYVDNASKKFFKRYKLWN